MKTDSPLLKSNFQSGSRIVRIKINRMPQKPHPTYQGRYLIFVNRIALSSCPIALIPATNVRGQIETDKGILSRSTFQNRGGGVEIGATPLRINRLSNSYDHPLP